MKFSFIGVLILCSFNIGSQIYIVNTEDDIDNGVCNAAHCSFREAINASEADSGLSTILFNIPGPAPHIISPNYPYPNINNSDLTIKGESQPGGPGAIVMDFKFNKFYGDPFWQILAPRFNISGIDFKNYLLSDPTDMLFRFGSFSIHIVADNSRIENCSFISDSFQIIPDYIAGSYLINVENANHIVFSKCNFGTDHSRSFIGNLDYAINAGQFGGNKNVTIIDSNLFLTKSIAIKTFDSLIAERNIFGTLDTTTNLNCVKSNYGIHKPGHLYSEYSCIRNNYFFGFQEAAIFSAGNGELIISNNQFHNNLTDINIHVDDTSIDPYGSYLISNNVGRNGRTFLNADNVFELYLENNEINNYDTAYYHKNNGGVQKSNTRIIRHIDNKFNCISKKLISLNPHTFPWHAIPTVKTVNRDQINGIGNPNDSVIVYFNQSINCPDAICEGGLELGRTQADGSGNWVLNIVYPNKSSISAFQFDSDPSNRPSMYSEFSECYQCPGIVYTNFNASLCFGQSINYRGRIFSYLNKLDSFLIKGDDISICDSMFKVNLFVYPKLRTQANVQICTNDTLKFGSVAIHQGHLLDSIVLQSVTGCDSTVLLNAVVNGLGQYSRTICQDSLLKIGNTTFSKDKLSGLAILKGGAINGCDSIIDVNLNIDYAKSIELPMDTTIHKGMSFVINPIFNFIPNSIKWKPDLFLDCDTCLNPVSKPDATVKYFLTVSDANGCAWTDQFTITVLVDKAEIFIPTAFSPNGDNINDMFEPVFKFPNSTSIKTFRIFDRWGNQVYERLNGTIGEIFGWDGTANGEKMNPGVYIYTIQFNGDDNVLKFKTGDITLVR